jgi:hypothetical protein
MGRGVTQPDNGLATRGPASVALAGGSGQINRIASPLGPLFVKYCDLHALPKQICYRVLPMPKAKLVFNLPEEDEEYKTCMAAGDLAVACEDVDNRCRALLKWSENPSDDAVRLAKEIRATLANVLCR